MSKTSIVGRFAPSPSGRMHLGNVFCALLAWLSVRAQGGHLLLRIEDLDIQRCRREYAVQLLEDLSWLGLTWDEGGLCAGFMQSDCGSLYAEALHTLTNQGMLYPCFCTRAELHAASAPHRADGQGIYPGTCRLLSPAQIAEKKQLRKPALRLRVPAQTITFTDGILGTYTENLAQVCGDFILQRSDGITAYQLAVVVDDARMGVTEVLRGSDLLSSTSRQIYLYQLLGYTPPRYYHIPLLCAPDGRRLSKRDRDLDLGVLRAQYPSPEPILGKLAYLAGLKPDFTPCTAKDLIPLYDAHKIPKHDIFVSPGFFLSDASSCYVRL